MPQEVKRLLLVLMMTLPGSPVVQFNGDIDQTQVTRVSLQDSLSSTVGANQKSFPLQSIDVSSSAHGVNETGSPPVSNWPRSSEMCVHVLTGLSSLSARGQKIISGPLDIPQ